MPHLQPGSGLHMGLEQGANQADVLKLMAGSWCMGPFMPPKPKQGADQ